MTLPRKELFDLPEGVLYLDGNSLGPLPKGAAERVAHVMRDEWGADLIKAWNTAGWMDLPRVVGDRIGQLIGAPEGSVATGDTLSIKVYQALAAARGPFREFMFGQTRENDLMLFAELGGYGPFQTPDDVPMVVLLPSFLTSELKTAFQIGFLLFVPFLIIDLVVASVLMSMGMMMLSPMLVSLPFKLMLFVLIDGWTLVASTLVNSFVV